MKTGILALSRCTKAVALFVSCALFGMIPSTGVTQGKSALWSFHGSLTAPPMVTGEVLRDGQPVEGATVTVFATGQSVTTGADGSFEIPEVSPPLNQIILIVEFEAGTTSYVGEKHHIELTPGSTTHAGVIELAPLSEMIVLDYTFDSGAEGWTFSSFSQFGEPDSAAANGSLSLISTTNQDTFGTWGSPTTPEIPNEGKLYRVDAVVRGNTASPADAADLRLRYTDTAFSYVNALIVKSNGSSLASPDTSTLRTFTTFIEDRLVPRGIFMNFDILNFSAGTSDAGFFLERVRLAPINSFDPQSAGNVVFSTDDSTSDGWTFAPELFEYLFDASSLPTSQATATIESNRLEIALNATDSFGYLRLDTAQAVNSDSLYLLEIEVGSNTVEPRNGPIIAGYVSFADGAYQAMEMLSSPIPGIVSDDYPTAGSNKTLRIWFEIPEELDRSLMTIVLESNSTLPSANGDGIISLHAAKLTEYDQPN